MANNTKILHSGRKPFEHHNTINAPIYASSSLVFRTLKEIDEAEIAYGRHGTQTTRHLEDLIKVIENGIYATLCPSGLSSITTAILGCVSANDHILLPNLAYEPTRIFASQFLTKANIEFDYYPSDSECDITEYIKPNTKAIFLESPASQTFEIDDIESIISTCKKHNIISIFDNTYSGGYFFKPLDHGADIVIQSCSKFFSGHSDVVMGCIVTNSEKYNTAIKNQYKYLGLHVSPRDCYFIQRGIRTLKIRLNQHFQNSLIVAKWLEQQEEIAEVLYPALESSKYHERFKKYFTGASGLFSFYFKEHITREQAIKFVENLQYFQIGYGWGGYESLVMFYKSINSKSVNNNNNYLIRLFIGLEEPEDLITDIKQAISNL
ncbi:MAG: cystathionine beta-lyase [Rickettsiales bacterium]|nr:cystathionine beta-lyase [Rickettsiales bacterium]